jgi:two-component system sensor histidine kinase TctE
LKSRKTRPEVHRSLFGEILDWMLAPLLFVWPVSIAATNYFANSVAAFPYDQNLREQATAISRLVQVERGRIEINVPKSARTILRSDEVDQVYFHVIQRNGKHLAGDSELPLSPELLTQPDDPGEVYFRDAEVHGQELRIAYMYVADPAMPRERWVLIEVGETLEKRSQLANRIVASVIVPQFVIIPLAVLLVWFGLTKGLQPLTRLRAKIEARRPGDVSEISTRGVPDELVPLIDAFNALIERTRKNMLAQQRFIADAAHQLRTPLAGLKMQAQLATRETDANALRDALANIVTGVDRSNRMISQMLAMARAEALDRQSFVEVDVTALGRQLAEDWFARAADKQIDFGYEADEGAAVYGSEFLLREMISNLIDNAVRYTPAGGQVTLRVLPLGDFVLVEVADTGIGISAADAEMVFEPFYRVDDSHSEGSGLGLAIVRQIADMHRADVSLRPSNEGRGTVARAVFPAFRRREDLDVTKPTQPYPPSPSEAF